LTPANDTKTTDPAKENPATRLNQPWHGAYAEAGINPDLPALVHQSLAELVQSSCEKFAHQTAFTCVVPNGMNGSLSFAQVNERSDAFAAYLRETLQLPAGARVAVQMPNSLGYPVAAFGIFKAGCVLVNINPLYTVSELVHQLNDSEATALVIVDMFAGKLPEVMRQTGLKHVIVAAVTEFFPAVPKAIVRSVQKVWHKVLPSIDVPHTRLGQALQTGRSGMAPGKVKSYWQSVRPADTAALQYTGGTTGVSKGAVLTHGNLLNNVNQMLAMGATHMLPGKECVLTALPLYHIFAFTANLLGFLSIGARNILIPSPRPIANLQRAVENYPLTWITGVNTLFNALLNEEWFVAYPPKQLKASIAGGAALHGAVAKRWVEVTKTPIAEGYGLTETSPVVSFNPLRGTPRLNSIGIATPGTQIRLVDELHNDVPLGEPGEVWVAGPQVMQGYWQRPEETAHILRDGWLATGDVAVMDSTGFMRIVDRKKDMILVSGFNVYPNEIEDVIARLPSVLEVAVIGVPDSRSGEAVRAYVVQNPEVTTPLTAEQVIAHCRLHLTDYKIPKSVKLKDELPKTPVGKVLRKDLKAEAKAELPATA
jgi:long-chain acyl-CoA synthetase